MQDRWSRPTTHDRRWLPCPSRPATDLIQALLQDRDLRLCSRWYRFHEFRPNRRQHPPRHERDSGFENINGFESHVHPNGAEEIKAHEFFRGVAWDKMHKIAPPFVPRFRDNQNITKYFEDEKDILSSETKTDSSIPWLPGAMPDVPLSVSRVQSDDVEATAARQEKHEVGMAAMSDNEFAAMKATAGDKWQGWKHRRIAQL